MSDDPRRCRHCGGSMVGKRSDAIYCSKRCKENYRNANPSPERRELKRRIAKRYYWRCRYEMAIGPLINSLGDLPLGPPAPRHCLRCGGEMSGPPSRKRHPECARLHNIERTMSLYRVAFENADVKRAMMWRYKLVEHLRERDGDRCALCRKVMRFGVTTGPRGGDDLGATIDHVLPRSLGGEDDLSNLQLAHWSCNRAKSNRGEPEQLRLVG